MISWKSRAGLFGKASWHDEFLRPSPLTTELHRFDEWLFRNASAGSQPDAGLEGASLASYGFLVQLDAARPLEGIAGVLQPSRDRAGRAYPLAVAAPLAVDADAHAEILPIALEDYWDAAVDAITAAAGAPPEAGQLEGLTGTPVDADPEAHDLYVDWIRRTTAAELSGWLDWPSARLAAAVRAIATELAPRLPYAPPGAEAIRVPLGRSAGAGLCFWLDAVRRAATTRAEIPSFFWAYDGQAGDALIFLGAPADAALSTLWRSVPSRTRVCDLTLVASTPAAETSMPSFDASVQTDDTLSALLDRVGTRVSAPA